MFTRQSSQEANFSSIRDRSGVLWPISIGTAVEASVPCYYPYQVHLGYFGDFPVYLLILASNNSYAQTVLGDHILDTAWTQ